MRRFYDITSIFGGGGGGSGRNVSPPDLKQAPTIKSEKAKEREAQIRAEQDALSLFKVQQAGFGGSERGTIRAPSSLATARSETGAARATSAVDRPGENDPLEGPPDGPEDVDVPPLSDVSSQEPDPEEVTDETIGTLQEQYAGQLASGVEFRPDLGHEFHEKYGHLRVDRKTGKRYRVVAREGAASA